MVRFDTRQLFLAGSALAALAVPASAAAAEMAVAGSSVAESDYLGEPILVTGRQDGYAVDDGSTATKTPTPLIDVPQAVATITEDQLDDQAVTQLNDALRYVPGVSLGTGEGHRDAVIVRGQGSTADFYLDGIRDDAQYYRATYNTDRIEVLKGANALIFGRGGGGGAINRVSKSADFGGPSTVLDASADTWGGFALTADANQVFSGVLAGRLAATYEEFSSHRDPYEGRFIGIAPTLGLRLGDATSLKLAYTYEDDARVVDRGIPALGDRPLAGYDRTFFGDKTFNHATNIVHSARVRLDHDFGGGLSFNATGHFADYDKYYANVTPSAATQTTATLSGYASATDRRNWIGQANLVWDRDFGAIGSTLLAGIEYGAQDTAAERFGAVFGPDAATSVTVDLAPELALPAAALGALTNRSRSDLTSLSAYLQEQLDFGPVQLVGGLRFERFDLATDNLVSGFSAARKDEKVSPRLALIAKPAQAISIYASYATSFLPQSGDQFTVLDATTAAFAPEKFENLELGAKYAITPSLLATAALFRLTRDNTRYTDPVTGITELTGASRTDGLELSLTGQIVPSWAINFGYTLLDGEVTEATTSAPAGQRLAQLPRHQLALWNRYDIDSRFGVGAGLVHQSAQFASLSNAVALPAYWRVDAAAYLTLSDRFAIQLNVENLTDTRYYASAHGDNNIQPAKPVTAKLGVSLTL